MSNRNIFMDMGADTEVELHLKSNAMSFSKLFGDGEKIKSEYLPENAGGGSVDLGPLEARVAALENAPKVADKSAEVTTLQGEVSTLQGTVAEHTTNIASNVQRITALESRPVPESVDLTPLSERVAALENAPKVADKSQEVTTLQGDVTTLQGVVAEHTTNIASNVQRITALESKTVPEGFDFGALTKRVEAFENKGYLTREKMCLLDVEFNGIADVAHYVTHYKGETYHLYNKFFQTKGGDVLSFVTETYPIGPEPKIYVLYCVTNGLTYKFQADGDHEQSEVFFNIPGLGELLVRSEYYGEGSIINSSENNSVAYQFKKLLGLS